MLLNATALYLQAKELQPLLVRTSDVCVEGMKMQTMTYDVYYPHLYSKHFLAKQTFCAFSLFSWCTRLLILCSSILCWTRTHTLHCDNVQELKLVSLWSPADNASQTEQACKKLFTARMHMSRGEWLNTRKHRVAQNTMWSKRAALIIVKNNILYWSS